MSAEQPRLNADDASTCSEESASDIFKSIPKGRTAFCIWKIEPTKTILLGRAKLGTFLTDSAYLIYAVSTKDGPLPYPGMPAKDLKDCQSLRAIHFWVGKDCEGDTSGAAALRAVELDSQLACTGNNNNNNNNDRSAQSTAADGAHLLMREAQGRESPRFLGYFRHREFLAVEFSSPDGVGGGSCSRLHRVSGTSIAVLTELRPVDWASFSSHDVILLDVPSRSVIFLWLGSSCEPLHKRHAARLLDELLKLKQLNQPRVFVLEDGYEQTLQLEARRIFDEILEPARRYVSPEPVQQKALPSANLKLYKCSDQVGKYKVAEVKSGPVSRNELESDSVFLLERGEAGVWAWVGRLAKPKERLEAVRNARGFVKKKGYSPSVPVARALEGHEPAELRSWLRMQPSSSSNDKSRTSQQRRRPLVLPASFDPDYMAERPRMAAECQLVDDGTSQERSLWVAEGKTGLGLVAHDRAIFYAESCYVLRYKYGYGRRARTIIYCWEGAQSSCTDREAALEAACLLAEQDSAQLVRTAQGQEPAHLLQIFAGKLIILSGHRSNNPPKKYLVRVYGSTPYTSKAVERPLRASSLDSGGVFILFSASFGGGGGGCVWCGSRSTGDAREASRRLAPANAPLVREGSEEPEFWAQLGGTKASPAGIGMTMDCLEYQEEPELEPHLYHLRVEKDVFVGEEILGFGQAQLLPEAAWLLEAANCVWVWIGDLAAPKPLKEYVEEAKIYLYTHPAARDRNTVISVVRQGLEPPTFIGLFDNWNHNLLRDYRSFESLQSNYQEQDPTIVNDIMSIKLESDFSNYVKYPMKILKSDPDKLPTGVDVSRKEMHLTFDDFRSVFKMEPTEFEKLPAWRRQRLKQTAGLF
ncbi:hypothetical protein TKK_0008468 [Trichogramma kaykai]